MAEFTKGPWTIRFGTTILAGNRLVGSTGGHQSNVNSDAVNAENEANAHLIAAAPDLYEALEAWNNWHYEVMSARVNGESIYGSADFDRMKADAQRLTDAALAKARGEK